MLSFTLLGDSLGVFNPAAGADAARASSQGAAPVAVATPTGTTEPTISIGPFVFDQDQINGLNATSAMIYPVARLSSTLSDPSYVPIDWAPFLQTVLLQPWAGTDSNGSNRNFGNYWYNDSFASDHQKTLCAPADTLAEGFAPNTVLPATTLPSAAPTSTSASGSAPSLPIVNSIAWQDEPIKQQSYRDWMTALGIQPDQDYFMGMISVFSTGTAYWDVAGWWNHFPVATFTNPNDNKIYGIWLQLTARGTNYVNVQKPTESWSQDIEPWPLPVYGCNQPFDMDMIVASIDLASSLVPKDNSWLQYINPGAWVGYLKAVWNNVIAPLSCDFIKGIPPGAAGQAMLKSAGWEGTALQLTAMFAQCGVTQAPDCTQAANVSLPACQFAIPQAAAPNTSPWYTQWWGIGLLVMIGIGSVLLLRSRTSPSLIPSSHA